MLQTFTISPDHPALPGHFPGKPIAPGVVILQQVITAVANEGYRVTGVANAKFIAPLLPGMPCTISLEAKGKKVQFKVEHSGGTLVQGTLEVEPTAA